MAAMKSLFAILLLFTAPILFAQAAPSQPTEANFRKKLGIGPDVRLDYRNLECKPVDFAGFVADMRKPGAHADVDRDVDAFELARQEHGWKSESGGTGAGSSEHGAATDQGVTLGRSLRHGIPLSLCVPSGPCALRARRSRAVHRHTARRNAPTGAACMALRPAGHDVGGG